MRSQDTIPAHHRQAMIDEGLDPGNSIWIEGPNGWTPSCAIDLSTDEAFAKTQRLLELGARIRAERATLV